MVFKYDETENDDYVANKGDRCYFCKRMLFDKMKDYAKKNGIKYVLEGTQADEIGGHRPGMRAAEETRTKSPLLEAGLTKNEIRILSKDMGIENWDKPQTPCLASRIPQGTLVTVEKLRAVEEAEDFIRGFGISNLRVRHYGDVAKIEARKDDFQKILSNNTGIANKLKALGFKHITLDILGTFL